MKNRAVQEIFWEIRSQYNQVPYPKYRNTTLDDLKCKYDLLNNMPDYIKADATYNKIINSMSQTIQKLTRQRCKGVWNNISERGINKAILPFINKKGNDKLYSEWISNKTDMPCSIGNGYWNAQNYMVMDIIGYIFLLKTGGDHLPGDLFPIFTDMESVRRRDQELSQSQVLLPNASWPVSDDQIQQIKNKEYSITFTDQHFRKFAGIKYSSNEILDLLMKTSCVELKIAYPVRIIGNRGKNGEEVWYSMDSPARLFEMGYINQNLRSDGFVQKRKYYVVFNTILGEMFVHNLLMRNYDFVDNSFYNLPHSAQIFYRQFLLHHNYPVIQLNLSTMKERMNLTNKNITNLVKTITLSILEPLHQINLIISYKKVDGMNGVKFEINMPKRTLKREEKVSDRGSVKDR